MRIGVTASVSLEGGRRGEGVGAHFADVGPFAGVLPLVLLEHGEAGKGARTMRAFVAIGFAVIAQMLIETLQIGFAADVTRCGGF